MKVFKRPIQFETGSLIDFCESITDCHHSSPKYINAGKIVIRNFNIKNGRLDLKDISYTDIETFYERISRAIPESGDLIITREAPMGEVCIIPDDVECCLGQRMVLIKPNKSNIDSEYLLYTLLSEYVQTQIKKSEGTGSIVSNLRIPILKDLQIPKRSIEIQKSIAKILSDLDAKIELNNKINRKLEAMAKTLYDYWFVQFDFPTNLHEPALSGAEGYKSSGGKMVYNAELKREIPEGWEVKKLGKELKTVLGGTPSTKNNAFWDDGEYFWLNSGEIANFPIITSELKITEDAILNSATSLMPKGTIAISITRHIRPSILAIEACANQSVIGILESDKLKSSYLYPFITNEVPRYLTLRTGAQQPHINKQTIDNTLIIIPKMEVLKSYYKIVNSIYNQIINNSFQNQHLTALRDWLLPMLMNGQVRVSER
jgi:type I restriction enzyme S subunit